mgnify:CR=1 FL=1
MAIACKMRLASHPDPHYTHSRRVMQSILNPLAAAAGPLTALQLMQDAPVIPVLVLTDPRQAVLLARALVAGGIRMLEVTLRTPQALACIEAIAREVALTGVPNRDSQKKIPDIAII